jgi:translation initiation factor 4A
VQQVSTVVNYDVPHTPETYLHRIGRSGRWGRKGMAINFATDRDMHFIDYLQRYFHSTIADLPANLDSVLV